LFFSNLCDVQYQFNNRIMAAAVARRPASVYEDTHTEDCGFSPIFPPGFYQPG